MTTLGSGHGEFDRSIKKTRIEAQFQQTLIANIPEHLIIDHILPRLPVKPLTRFKVVSKFWLSIISSFDFAQTHLKFSSLRPQFVVLSESLSLDLDEQHKLFLLPYEENNNGSALIGLDLDHNGVLTKIDIVGSYNGLVCLYLEDENENGNFCLWNPVTKQCREIENPDGEGFACNYWFGYASSVDDYKLVALCTPNTQGIGDFYVFSVRADQWKIIDGSVGFHIPFSLNNCTVVFDDILYWPPEYPEDRQTNLDWQKAKCIVGFDLVDGKLKEIPWMDWFIKYNDAYFFKMEGRLSLLCQRDEGSDVLVQKQYDDWNSWEKLFSVNLGVRIYFLKFTETGKCLVKSSGRLKVIDPSKYSTEESHMGVQVSGQIARTVTRACAYVESFISPFDPFS